MSETIFWIFYISESIMVQWVTQAKLTSLLGVPMIVLIIVWKLREKIRISEWTDKFETTIGT